MGRGTRNIVAAVSVLGMAACLPLPWITPPLSVSFGPEIRATIDRADDPPADEVVDVIGASYRFGLHPLQLWPSLHERPIDIGVGWQLLTGDDLSSKNGGPYLEGLWFFYDQEVMYEDLATDPVRFRLGTALQLRLHNIDDLRFGAAVQLNAEWASFVSGAAAECDKGGRTTACYIGAGHGEAGAGFFVNVAVADYGTRRMLTATGGIILRLPASAGAALFIFL